MALGPWSLGRYSNLGRPHWWGQRFLWGRPKWPMWLHPWKPIRILMKLLVQPSQHTVLKILTERLTFHGVCIQSVIKPDSLIVSRARDSQQCLAIAFQSITTLKFLGSLPPKYKLRPILLSFWVLTRSTQPGLSRSELSIVAQFK